MEPTEEQKRLLAEEEARKKSASAGQPTVEQQLAEIQKKLQEKDTQIIQLIERNNRAESLLQSYANGAVPSAQPENQQTNPYGNVSIDANQLMTNPQETVAKIIQVSVDEALKRARNEYQKAEWEKDQANQIRTVFYRDNPELVGWEKIVGAIEDEIRALYPKTNYTELLPIIANKAKQEVAALKQKFSGGSPAPIGLEIGGGNAGGGKPPSNEPKEPTDDENFQSYLDERRQRRTLLSTKVPITSPNPK